MPYLVRIIAGSGGNPSEFYYLGERRMVHETVPLSCTVIRPYVRPTVLPARIYSPFFKKLISLGWFRQICILEISS